MPDSFVHGVPASVDGAGMQLAAAGGAHWIHQDRMWHYTEGIRNWDPVWRGHGIRILPGPSSLWVDARGERLPALALPGFDTTSTLRHLRSTGHDHSWFVLTRDRKSTRLNSSHVAISYAVFCLKNKISRAQLSMKAQ